MVEPGTIAIAHVEARIGEGEDAGTLFETTDVDVAMREDVYDPHRDYRPLEFEVGADEVPPAVDELVRALSVGDDASITVGPAKAFGERDDGAVVDVDRDALERDDGTEAAVGKPVLSENGELGWISDVREDAVTVDFNHEFAGEAVTFDVRLVDVREPTADEEGGSEVAGEGGSEVAGEREEPDGRR